MNTLYSEAVESAAHFSSFFKNFFTATPYLGYITAGASIAIAAIVILILRNRYSRLSGRFYRSAGKKSLIVIFGIFLGLWIIDIFSRTGLLYRIDSRLHTDLTGMMGYLGQVVAFAVFFTVIIILAWAICAFFYKNGSRSFKNRMLLAAIAVWSCGFILYFIGYYHEGTRLSPAALIIRPAISATELFISSIDLLEVGAEYKEDPIYMGAFAITSLMALLVSAFFVFHLLGASIKSWMKLKSMDTKNETLYIFWGVNQPSVLLAKDIQDTSAGIDPRDGFHANIVFVDSHSEGHESGGGRMSLGHILNSFFVKRDSYDKIKDAGPDACLCLTEYDITDICGMPGKGLSEKLKKSGLEDLDRVISDAADIHIFFLSDNEEANIRRTIAASDLFSGYEIEIYCHACLERYNYNQLFFAEKNAAHIKIIDSALLAVNMLKSDPESLPVNFVKPDTAEGVATKPFISAIIGFGETGMEAFKFLYEFSAFVRKKPADATDDWDEANPFRCHIFDPEAKAKKEHMYMKMPSLKDVSGIEFIDASSDTPGFWDKIGQLIKELDYIVVCIGDDKTGISVATDIYEYALRTRPADSRFKILVRSYNAGNSMIAQYIARHPSIIDKNYLNWDLSIFGSFKTIFTKENVLDSSNIENAKLFYYEYQSRSSESAKTKLAETPDEEWALRERNLQNGSLADYNKLIHQEQQDISNSLHIETKMRLAGITDSDSHILLQLLDLAKGRKGESDTYPDAGSMQPLLDNLAKCEHLRWCASSILLGYTTYLDNGGENKKDYIGKRLSCLVSNKELRAIKRLAATIHYDQNVVDVSFKIKAEQKKPRSL